MSEHHPDQGANPDPYAAPHQPPAGDPPTYSQQPPLGGDQPQQPAYGEQPSYGTPPPPPSQPPYGEQPSYGTPPPPSQPPYGVPPAGSPYSAPAGSAYGQGPSATSAYGDDMIGYASEPPKRSRRGALLGAGALALTMVAGVGVYAATQVDGGGTQPEEVVPASAFAFGKIDLDPAADQKVAIKEFAGKFPKATKPTGDEDAVDALVRGLFEQDECVDYANDVKPVLGDRVGMAGIRGTDGKPEALVILQIKDEKKFREQIAREDDCDKDDAEDEFQGFAFAKGYAVLAETQATADAAVKQAAEASLADAKNFKGDLGKLDGNQVVVMWADMAKSFDAASQEEPQLGMVPNAVTKYLKGRVVLGLHMEGDYAEVYGQTIEGAFKEIYGDNSFTGIANLGELPANTVAAVSVNGLEDYVTKMLDQLGSTGVPVDDFMSQLEQETGLSLKGDVLPLLGSKTTISLGDMASLQKEPKIGLKSTVKDPAKAKKVGKQLVTLAKQSGATGPVAIESTVDGQTFYLTTRGYSAELKGDGGLGATPAFQRAMGDLSDSLAQGVYVNIEEILKGAKSMGATAEDVKDLEPLRAYGMSVGKKDEEAFFRLRLVVK